MVRDVDALTGRTFDVLVIGGGIYGLTIAYDAAQRGLSVALIDRDDFGSGASFNHLRTIHGGLRYLQTLDIVRARESMIERRTIATIAPHHVRPLPFAVPVGGSLARSAAAMRAGFLIDRLLTRDRNRGVPPSHALPPGRLVGGDELRRLAAEAPRWSVAAVWYDYVTTEADRLTFAFALAAAGHGATLANHVEATALIVSGDRVTGARARDRLGARDLEIAARITVGATAGDVDALLASIGRSTGMPRLKALNLVTRREAAGLAVGSRSSSGRYLFRVPWRGRALFGTWEAGVSSRGLRQIDEDEVVRFLGELNVAFPDLALTLDDVTMVHSGIVPGVAVDGAIALAGHEQVRDHAAGSAPRFEGLMSVAGAKYTTARAVAERVTDRLVAKLEKQAAACRTASTPLPGGDVGDVSASVNTLRTEYPGLSDEVIGHLVDAYGSGCANVLGLCAIRPELAKPISESSPVIGAELVRAVQEEMAETLADAIVRRTPLGALGHPGEVALRRAADLVGAARGWPEERRQREIAAVEQFYASVQGRVNASKT
jgi:glycerol-3-phosphate dehydrogenase